MSGDNEARPGAGAVLELVSGAALVVIEGYSFASRGRAIIGLGELGGCVRLVLHDRGVPFIDVAPAQRAMYATGRGNAGKNEVLAAAIRRLDYDGHSEDEADALWLLAMARDAYALPGAPQLPAAQREVLQRIPWPALGVGQPKRITSCAGCQ